MTSGKPFTKTAVLLSCLSSIIACALVTASTIADEQLYPEALEYLQRSITKNVTLLGDQASRCNKKYPVEVTKLKPQLPNLSIDELSAALLYIDRNYYVKCVKEVELELNSLLEQFDNLVEHAKGNNIMVDEKIKKQMKDTRRLMSSTSAEAVLLQARYKMFPENVRKKLESIDDLKNKSFDVFKIVDELRKAGYGKET